MKEIKIFEKPLSNSECNDARNELGGNCFLSMSSRFHLIDSLKELKFGKPGKYQQLVDDLVKIIELRVDDGAPFSSDVVNGVWDNDEPVDQLDENIPGDGPVA